MRWFLLCIIFFFHLNKYSQNIGGIENFILASQQDQEILIQEYFKPYIQFQSNIEKIKGHILIKIYSVNIK